MSLWFNCVLVVTVLLVPTAIALSIPTTMVPVWLALLIFAVLLIKLLLFRTRDFLYASLLCFFYIFMILAPLLQMMNGTFPWIDFYDEDSIEMAWWITAMALLFFEIGYLLFKELSLYKAPRKSIETNSLELNTHGGLVLFLAAIACTAVALAFNGIDNLFLPRNEVALILDDKFEGSSPIQAILKSFMRVPPTVILLIFIYDAYKRFLNKTPHWFNTNTLFMLTLGLTVAVVNNPISTARFWVGAIFFSTLLLLLCLRDRKSAFFWFAFNLSIVVVVFPLSDIYRKQLDFNPLVDKLEVDPTRELIVSPDFDAFQQQMNTTIVVDDHGFLYGKQFMSSILFFVPRLVWPDKAEPTGRYLAESLNYRFGNLSTPLMAEFYIDWGFPGVTLGMLLLGMMYHFLYFSAQRRTLLLTVFYCFMSAYQFYLLRGSLMTVTNYMLVALATILIIQYFSSYMFKQSSQPI